MTWWGLVHKCPTQIYPDPPGGGWEQGKQGSTLEWALLTGPWLGFHGNRLAWLKRALGLGWAPPAPDALQASEGDRPDSSTFCLVSSHGPVATLSLGLLTDALPTELSYL